MDPLTKDLRYALKLLAKDRGFTLAALLTLSLCIGANAAIFSVVDSILLRPLPFHEPDRIVHIYNSYPRAGVERGGAAVPDFYDRQELQAFSAVSMHQTTGMSIGESGRPERVTGMGVTPSFFPLLGARAHLGRTFSDEEGEPGSERVAVLSWGIWQTHFGGAGDVVGRTIRISDRDHEIVGVMPRGFVFEDPEVAVWTPLAFSAEQRSDDARHSNSWTMLARLSDGWTVARAQAEVHALNARLDEQLPQFAELLRNVGYSAQVVEYQADLTRNVRGTLWLLQAGVLLVLLIGCVNIANLVLVRSTARHRELATRSAIGAPQSRLARQLLTESLLLALAGGAIGVLLAWAGVQAIGSYAAEHLPRGSEVALDFRAVLVAAATAIGAGLIFGAIPVVRVMNSDLSTVFREEGRTGTAGRRTHALRGGLVIAQVSLAFALLIGAGLMIVSFARMLRVETGFDASNVLTAAVNLPTTRYADGAARRQFMERLLEDVRAIPGVTNVAATNVLPFSGDMNSSAIAVEGYVPEPGESLTAPVNSRVSAGWFETMGVRIAEGRSFTTSDTDGAPDVAVVDRVLAERYWPGQSPIGRRITQGVVGITPDDELNWRTVVGVVDRVRMTSVANPEPPGHYYVPLAQVPAAGFTLVVKSAVEPSALAASIRAAARNIDPDLPVYGIRTMEERVAGMYATERARMILLAGFGALALLLAAIGIYGVLAYSVAQRSGEIGIRMALGSSTADVFRMVVGQGARLVIAGLALGIAGSIALSRVVRALLYEVQPTDPPVYGLAVVLLAAAALLACVIPARRAMRVDPLVAMRER